MAWPTSLTYGTYNWFLCHIGQELGWDPNYNTWDYQKNQTADSILQRGLRKFYNPPPMPTASNVVQRPTAHKWSFLNPVATITTASGDADYDLPSDFNGAVEGFTFASASGKRTLRLVNEEQMRAARSVEGSANNTPLYAALRPKTSAGTSVQLWEALLYPTPNATLVISYRYRITPALLSSAAPYPLGGTLHVPTILAAMLAEVELHTGKGPGARHAEFMEMLAASIQNDVDAAKTNGSLWEATPPERGTYSWLVLETGIKAGLPTSLDVWSTDEFKRVERIVKRGVAFYYRPPKMPGQSIAHEWSFLCPSSSFDTVAGTREYELDTSIAYIRGPLNFVDENTGYEPIVKVSEERLRHLATIESSNGIPRYYSVKPNSFDGTAAQTFIVVLHPTPDSAYELSYRYALRHPEPSTSAEYLPGGPSHAEGLLAACDAIAEADSGKTGPAWKRFMDLLTSGIAEDIRNGPEYFGSSGALVGMTRSELRKLQMIPFGTPITYNGSEWTG